MAWQGVQVSGINSAEADPPRSINSPKVESVVWCAWYEYSQAATLGLKVCGIPGLGLEDLDPNLRTPSELVFAVAFHIVSPNPLTGHFCAAGAVMCFRIQVDFHWLKIPFLESTFMMNIYIYIHIYIYICIYIYIHMYIYLRSFLQCSENFLFFIHFLCRWGFTCKLVMLIT